MITRKMTKDEVQSIIKDGGNFMDVGLEIFAENFFEYGFQKIVTQLYQEDVKDLLANLEVSARAFGNETCGAVLGKAVLRTYNRRQVVTDALSYLSRAAAKGVKGAATELCLWYAARIRKNDLDRFRNVDLGLDDCYDPTPEFPRQMFPHDVAECRRRLIRWLGVACEEDFDGVRTAFAPICGSLLALPPDKASALTVLEGFVEGGVSKEQLSRAKALIDSGMANGRWKDLAEGARIVRELAAQTDSLEVWRYMLDCHERGIGPFKTNKCRRDATQAIKRLEKP